MKLGLLVVVAVAVLLPSFSESRIVSKCELRDKLKEKINLPKALEEGTLATVICELNRRSHLNTSLITVFGKRIPTTPKPTVITKAATVKPTNINSTTTEPTNTTATRPAATESTSSMNATLQSNSTLNGKGQKWKADSKKKEENKFDKEEMGQDDGQMEDEKSVEEDTEDNMEPWSLGLYGLFQLSDSQFCDSGYRWSKNVCHTSCTAFTDDDITDDIACVIKTGYWRLIAKKASRSCLRTLNFFKECN